MVEAAIANAIVQLMETFQIIEQFIYLTGHSLTNAVVQLMLSSLVEAKLLMQYAIYYGAPCGKTEIASHATL